MRRLQSHQFRTVLHSRSFATAVSALALLLSAGVAAGQTGFTGEAAEGQRSAEAELVDAIEPAELEAMSRTLSARMHVAGGPGQAAVRDTIVAWFERWGFEPEVETYEVFLPWATEASLALTAPESIAFRLGEEPVPADPPTAEPVYPWVNGYSAPGEVEGEVVYASYGLHEDYERLDSLGVDVTGRVVIARYGRSFRGVKARLAEEEGAAALLLYSDPQDDGYVRGDVYPAGPFRAPSGVQRGSVMNDNGDPTTPGGPSLPGSRRVPPEEAEALPRIPVMPISYEIAGEILSRIGGADLPDQAWQGGLPFRYHVGPGPARVAVRIDDDRSGPAGGIKPLHNVFARLQGSDWPDEWVVVGAHIDAWGTGADDNVSGTASILAAARAIRALADQGRGPRRTIVFAGWDGEEWGLLGSTEWVEEHAEAIRESVVAYINQDGIGGTVFGAAGSSSLKPLVREAARAVPAGDQSLYDDWAAADGDTLSGADDPTRMGDLGGGSDFSPFYNHLGIPSTGHGFTTPGGIYHSAYDTHRWMSQHGDAGFVHHARSAELTALLALRLANAEVLPYDYASFAGELAGHWEDLDRRARARGLTPVPDDPLGSALEDLRRAGETLNSVRARYLAGPVEPAASRQANDLLRQVERALTRPEGLVGRAWYRNLAFAADGRNGYATLALPSIAEALRSEDDERYASEVRDLADRVVEATDRVREATVALGG